MCWIYSAVIEPNLLYGVAFWWTALDKQHNFRLLVKVRRSAAIYITDALRRPSKDLVRNVEDQTALGTISTYESLHKFYEGLLSR